MVLALLVSTRLCSAEAVGCSCLRGFAREDEVSWDPCCCQRHRRMIPPVGHPHTCPSVSAAPSAVLALLCHSATAQQHLIKGRVRATPRPLTVVSAGARTRARTQPESKKNRRRRAHLHCRAKNARLNCIWHRATNHKAVEWRHKAFVRLPAASGLKRCLCCKLIWIQRLRIMVTY